MANPILAIKNVTKKFGSFTAVKNLSLNVQAGEVYGLIGPNGSGKTTTIKMVTGLYKPTRGSVLIHGFGLSEAPTRAKRHLGYVPDEPMAYDRLTGREFLQFVGELFGMDRRARDHQIDQLLREFQPTGATSFADTYLGDASRGTRQKISFIAALMHDPTLIVIDEPMVGLDPTSIRTVERLLRRHAERERGVLMATHTLAVAEAVCDRIGIIKDGVLIDEGYPDGLKRKYGVKRGGLEEVYMRAVKQ